MITKELIDARWKVIVGLLLSILTTGFGALSYDLMRSALSPAQLDSISNTLGSNLAEQLSSYGSYVWRQAFSPFSNGGAILMIVAMLIGASLIAAEVNKGTIFLLLSRPLSRDRILLTKYGVGAVLLLGMSIIMSSVLEICGLIAGHTLDLGGLAISTLLYWLGMLFIYGLTTMFSVLFSDVLRPIGLTVVVLILLMLPSFLPHGGDWVLPAYWASLQAFLGQAFPTKELIISLVAAIVPVAVAVPLFRRQAY